MSEPKMQIVCGTCGSADVRRDAWAEWDSEKQDWVLGSVFDDGHCNVCEGESSLDEVPLTEWNEQLVEAKELNGLLYQAEEDARGDIKVSVFNISGATLWTATKDRWGAAFSDLEDALNTARAAILKEEVNDS